MKPRSALTVLVLITVASLVSADVPSLVQEALQAKSKGGADGVLVLDSKSITRGEDGRVLTRIRQVQRLLTDEGLDAYGDPFLPFNAAHQDVDVKVARTTRSDGEKVEITPNALSEITPKAVSRAPWYADMQDMIVTLLGLEIGSATEFDASIEDREPFRKHLWGSEPLHDGRDIEKKEISITLPPKKKLAWYAAGISVEPDVNKTGGSTEYVFRFEDLPATNQHEAHGHAADLAPVLYWMEKTSTKKLARRLLGAAPYALGKEKASKEADAIVSILDREFEEEMLDPMEEALGIHRRVVDDIAAVHVDRSVFGDRVRKPSKAFQSGYADAIEKLGILHTVYSRLGYDPIPLVVLRHDPGGAMRLHPDNVEGLWLRIAVQGRYLYLDTSSTGGTGEPRSEHVFVLTSAGLEEAGFVHPATTRMRFEAVVDLTAEEPVVKGTLKMRGAYNPYWGMFTSGGGDAAQTLGAVIGKKAGVEVISASFLRLALDETIISFTAKPLVEEGVLDITLPSLAAGLASEWELWRPDRDLPILIKEKKWEKARVEVRLPEGAKVLYSPTFEETTGKSGPVSIFHSKGLDAKHVSIARRVTFKPGTIPAQKVKKLKDLLGDALSPSRNRIVVKLP